jgi:cell division protein FtsN
MKKRARNSQRGGFAMGLIVGLLIGLALALGVALYVTKVPVPFVNKVPQRTAEQDAAEVEKNKNWDPNGPLYGKNPAKPTPSPSAPAVPTAAASAGSNSAAVPGPRASGPARDVAANAAQRPVASASQAGSTKPGADPFAYFVQAGAYARSEDAEQQRARLAMLGFEARLTEREQSGRTMYRVRVGPFDKKESADSAKDKLSEAGVEAALVRVQK